MKDYTVMNLAMISRLAVLENAGRTGKAIDDLVAILRYENETEQSMSTVLAELKIVEKMYALHEVKKGPAFCGVIQNSLKEDKCYIDRGELVAYVALAIGKKIADNKERLEVIVSVEQKDDKVVIKIKDDGDIYKNELEQHLADAYATTRMAYDREGRVTKLTMKPRIGTTIELIR